MKNAISHTLIPVSSRKRRDRRRLHNIGMGGHEMLLSDTLTIVGSLKKNGVPVGLDVQPEMFHIYAIYGNMMTEAKRSYSKILEFVRGLYRLPQLPSSQKNSLAVGSIMREGRGGVQ